MNCPFCGYDESKVIDSRPTDEGTKTRRRRECLQCTERFTTYELVETLPLMVVKKDNSRQPFDREKLLNRLLRACGKRPVATSVLEEAISSIESSLLNSFVREVTSQQIAELCMQRLKDIDIVAYIRFVSVYREFSTIDEFMKELRELS